MGGRWDPTADDECMGRVDRLTPTEASAKITSILLEEGEIHVQDVANVVGYRSTRSARRLLERMSRVLPIYYDEDEGVWRIL